ncbi:LysR family transcriptional regulator [Simiduia aestuariiviva]|uniref:DNA-binding transcriptional LysR family regulator n=1 Tax=Simiduia aestuariiviva TaxID=1510459 RepID=A0A839UQ10_9GAMM|nr:LysR family transcriptional regulator [Simiduia aestuariiviva]MBB3167906.1 DNA-binding transcriptional LysR family regulator [Simiduia aestuariiviva]
MINWDDYRVLLAIQRSTSLRAAAKSLGVNHSTVQRRCTTINQKYASKLIEQTGASYRLSELGLALSETAEKLESLILEDERLYAASQIELAGEIKLSLPPPFLQFLLLDDINGFRREHPGIKLTVQSSFKLADLNLSEAHVVIRVSNHPAEHLVGHRLFPIGVNYYANQDYLNNTARRDLQWITAQVGPEHNAWIADSPYPEAPCHLSIDDITARHQAAASGHGMIRGANYIASHFPDLVPLHKASDTPFQDVWVLTHPDFIGLPRIKRLIQALVSALKQKRQVIEGNI